MCAASPRIHKCTRAPCNRTWDTAPTGEAPCWATVARVLVTSASEDLREVLRDLLQQDGHSVVEAAGRDEALAAAAPIDLLLVDIDGGPEFEDLVLRFRQVSPGRKVVTIGISADPAARGDAAVDHPIRSVDEILYAVRSELGARP